MSTGDGIPINKTRTDKDSLETETAQVTVQIFVRQARFPFSAWARLPQSSLSPHLAKSSSCISPESIRKELKVSRVELAKRSDLSVTALYNIENNLSFPPKETIEKLCGSLHIPVSYLMLYSLTEDDVPDDKREFFKLAVGPVKAFLMGK